MSQRGLVAAVVPGIGWACFADWLSPKGTVANHVRRYGYDQTLIDVDSLSSSTNNAAQIRDAIMAEPAGTEPPRIVLVGYSKGTPDILEAAVRYPEIRSRVAAVVSIAGAVGGSALADDAEQWQADFLRHWPGANCDKSDEGAVNSLRSDVRKRWLADNPLPTDVRFYSVVALPVPDHVSRVLGSSYRKLGKIDWRNDSQVIYSDEIVPGSTLLGFLNADHWAVATPFYRSHPSIASSLVTQNAYPREALLEAILRFVEEDLGQP
jgi:pimeloyl-ACP methyl ester carboxylesterase